MSTATYTDGCESRNLEAEALTQTAATKRARTRRPQQTLAGSLSLSKTVNLRPWRPCECHAYSLAARPRLWLQQPSLFSAMSRWSSTTKGAAAAVCGRSDRRWARSLPPPPGMPQRWSNRICPLATRLRLSPEGVLSGGQDRADAGAALFPADQPGPCFEGSNPSRFLSSAQFDFYK